MRKTEASFWPNCPIFVDYVFLRVTLRNCDISETALPMTIPKFQQQKMSINIPPKPGKNSHGSHFWPLESSFIAT